MDRTDWERRQYDADRGRRAALIQGLIEAAHYFDAHPDLPLPHEVELHYSIRGRDDEAGAAEAARIAGVLGTVTDGDDTETGVSLAFSSQVRYRALYISSSRMDAHYALNSYHGSVRPESLVTA